MSNFLLSLIFSALNFKVYCHLGITESKLCEYDLYVSNAILGGDLKQAKSFHIINVVDKGGYEAPLLGNNMIKNQKMTVIVRKEFVEFSSSSGGKIFENDIEVKSFLMEPKHNVGNYSAHFNEYFIFVGNSPQLMSFYFTIQNLDDVVRMLKENLSVFIFTSDEVKVKDIGGFLAGFWKYFKVLHTVALTPCANIINDEVITYKPFEPSGKGFGQVHIYKTSDVIKNPNLIYNNIDNLNQYPMKISIFERKPSALKNLPESLADSKIYYTSKNGSQFYGLDGVVVSQIAGKMNFSIDLDASSATNYYGTVCVRNKCNKTGSLFQIVNREIDIQANGRYINWYGTDRFEFLGYIDYDSVCVIVPKSEIQPKWIGTLKIFKNKNFGLVLIFLVFVLAVINWLIKRSQLNYTPWLEIFAIVVEQSQSTVLVNTHSPVRRIFIGSATMFLFVISAVFLSHVIDTFSTESDKPDIENLEEFDQSGLLIRTSYNLFQGSFNKLYQRLEKKVKGYNHNISSLKMAAYGKKSAALERLKDAKWLLKTVYVDETGRPLLHIIPEYPGSYYITFIVPLGWPFLRKVNSLITSFKEYGFCIKWSRDFLAGMTPFFIKYHGDSHKPYSLYDVLFAFIVLAIGLTVSCCAFVGEIIWFYYLQKRSTVIIL